MLTKTQSYTPKEYLELEENTEERHEYRDGDIVPMTGGTTNHNEISLNLASHLKFGLRKQNYRVYIGDVKVWIPRYRQYTYPDVMVIAGEPVYPDQGTTTVINPILITEVLSQPTKNYDQGDQFLAYRSIPDLQEYILIDQNSYHVVQYVKQNDQQWLLTEYQNQAATIPFKCLQFTIPLLDLYEGVDFTLI
ncbi:MAG: Uma2 family endonuclease [Cyanobacteria bacterium]|jgi:Uma2 family endonuclease|nr:Uma2 family endonuclease [Cyanobacteria bacterium GSL.Bin21]